MTLRKDGVKAFLRSLLWRSFPAKATKNNLISLVWSQQATIHAIFDRAQKSVRKYNIEAFFLVMLTSHFIKVERWGGELLWVIGTDGVGVLDTDATFECDKNWVGIPVFPQSTKWKHKLASYFLNLSCRKSPFASTIPWPFESRDTSVWRHGRANTFISAFSNLVRSYAGRT